MPGCQSCFASKWRWIPVIGAAQETALFGRQLTYALA
jgi:hypothetical protein